jgi:hypothetical protein
MIKLGLLQFSKQYKNKYIDFVITQRNFSKKNESKLKSNNKLIVTGLLFCSVNSLFQIKRVFPIK